jgi:hypothetical protein
MAFDPYSATQATLTGTTIPATKDQTIVQDRSTYSHDRSMPGMLVMDWSYDSEADNWDSSDELPIGTYTTKFKIPDGAILTGTPIVNTWEAKAGSGTITPTLTGVALAAISTAGVAADDGAGDVLVAGYEATADMDLTVAVATDTITAGGFTIMVPYVLGDQSEARPDLRHGLAVT